MIILVQKNNSNICWPRIGKRIDANICEVYKLFIDKNLKYLKTERYFAHILPALVKCMENRNKKNSIERYMEIKLFAIEIIRFTKVKSTAEFVQQAINELVTDKRIE